MSRKDLYKSKAWRTVRQNIINKQGGLCSRCRKAPVYIVHHKIHLTDENYQELDVALAEENLEGLCKRCHNLEHNPSSTVRGDVRFDDQGNMIKR